MSGRVREKERGRVGDRRRDKDDRDRKASDRARRHATPDRTRSRHAPSRIRSPDRRRRSRSRSPSRSPERSNRRRRTPSSEPQLRSSRRRDDNYDDGDEDRRKGVSDLVDGIAREHQQKQKQKQKGTDENNAANGGGDEVEVDAAAAEIEMMKKLAIPMGFDSTKGKPVPGADVSGVRVMTKLQPRRYMNRRGGFSRPLPAERNR